MSDTIALSAIERRLRDRAFVELLDSLGSMGLFAFLQKHTRLRDDELNRLINAVSLDRSVAEIQQRLSVQQR